MRPNARTCTHISHCRQSPPHAHALVRLICRLQLHRRQSSLAELIEFSPRDRRERSQSSRWWKDLSQRSSLYPRQKARVLHDRIAIIRVAAAVELSCVASLQRAGLGPKSLALLTCMPPLDEWRFFMTGDHGFSTPVNSMERIREAEHRYAFLGIVTIYEKSTDVRYATGNTKSNNEL